MKILSLLMLSLVVSPMARAGDDEIDIGRVANVASYAVGVPASAAAYFLAQRQINATWRLILPNETGAFQTAARELNRASTARDNAVSAFESVRDEFVKARDGYSYTTSRTEYQFQWVPVETRHANGTSTWNNEYRHVPVTVHDTHHVSPDPSRARSLRPRMDRLEQAAAEQETILSRATNVNDTRAGTLERAQAAVLAGERSNVNQTLVQRIRNLNKVRVGAFAIGAGLAAYGAYDLIGRNLINSAEAAPLHLSDEQPGVADSVEPVANTNTEVPEAGASVEIQ